MARGKCGAQAAKRQEVQALEAEVTKLRHALARAERDRDEAKTNLSERERTHAATRRQLLAEIEAASSDRVRQLEDAAVALTQRAKTADAEAQNVKEGYEKLVEWFRDHMIDVHNIRHADWLEQFYAIVSGENITTSIGTVGARKYQAEPDLSDGEIEKVRVIQRARGLRK